MQRNLNLKNRMREIRSSGTVGVRGGNEPLYPEKRNPLAMLSSGSFLEVRKKQAKPHRTLLNSKLSQSYLRKIRLNRL